MPVTLYPASSTALRSASSLTSALAVTVAVFFSRSTRAVTPANAFRALSTRPEQWAHIMPSMVNVLSIPASAFCMVSFSDFGQTDPFHSRSRRALVTTHTELRLMAAAAIMGLSVTPSAGYSTPAATGIPMAL